jgi:hypothetical protein
MINAALFDTGHCNLRYDINIYIQIGMLLITNCLELDVVAARGHKLASREHAITMPPRPCHEPG